MVGFIIVTTFLIAVLIGVDVWDFLSDPERNEWDF